MSRPAFKLDLDPPQTPSDTVSLDEICRIARELTGVQLNERHRMMVSSRLQTRLQELQISTLKEYVIYLKANPQSENPKFIALLTTHHTYFFREFSHFEYILATALPAILPIVRTRPDKTLRIWSAACSRGQEAYSLSMFLEFHLKRLDPTIKFEILGTDIDAESVAIATNGVYSRRELKEVPLQMLGDHWARGTGEIAEFVKAKKSLRAHCSFRKGSLLDEKELPTQKYDLIFCRNVFIYFNSEQIKKITSGLLSRLEPTGYLFIGISESLNSLNLPVVSRAPSVYQHKTAAAPAAAIPTIGTARNAPAAPAPASAPAATMPNPIRVVCVDDSSSILVLMKQILTREQGFEIIGTAVNGLEAAERISALKPDAVTLDIHMPQQTGIEYLQKNYRAGHPSVVVVSSVSREDSGLALQALKSGAADYVEKPALGNLQERGDEIRTKLRCAVQAALLSAAPIARVHAIDQAFAKKQTMQDPSKGLRVIVLPLSARGRLKDAFCGASAKGEPPTVILVEGATQALGSLKEEISRSSGKPIQLIEKLDPAGKLGANTVYLGDFKILIEELFKARNGAPASIQVMGEVSQHAAKTIQVWVGTKSAQLILEDLGDHKGCQALRTSASDVVPATSFIYLANEYLCKTQK